MPTSSELRDSQHSVDEVAAGASELPGGVAAIHHAGAGHVTKLFDIC